MNNKQIYEKRLEIKLYQISATKFTLVDIGFQFPAPIYHEVNHYT